ncbi:DUF6233 domain-containing protein [Streptomyces albidoflavus]|uniref:DUF6233 domain-containing protein n=1 Tax=Streptomyces TaxID=1883 RepID=UPI0033AC1CBF
MCGLPSRAAEWPLRFCTRHGPRNRLRGGRSSSATVRADEAPVALTDPRFEPCPRCRPDSALGMDAE